MVVIEKDKFFELVPDADKVFYAEGYISEGACISKTNFDEETKNEYENREMNIEKAEALASAYLIAKQEEE